MTITLLQRFFMKPRYLPLEDVALINDTDVNNLKAMYSKNKKDERFKIINQKLHCIENYKYPFADELDDLRQKALIIAHNENTLCQELSKLSGIKKTTLDKYFYRFTFKQTQKAKKIMNLLVTFIERNSLIPVEELNYDY